MRRTKAEAAETREAILDAAEFSFLDQGVSQTSMNDIAKRAGVTRGAIYFHFKDKTDIYFAMLERIRFPQEELIEEAERSASVNPIDIIESSSLGCFERFAEDEHQKRILTILMRRCEYVGESEKLVLRLRQAHDEMVHLFERMLYVAQKRNMLSPDWAPEQAAYAVVACVGGIMGEWIDSDCAFDMAIIGPKTLRPLIQNFRASEVRAIPVHPSQKAE